MAFDLFSGFQTMWNNFNFLGTGDTILLISLIGLLIFSLSMKTRDKLLLTNLTLTGILILGLTSSNVILAVNSVLAVFTVLAQVQQE